MTVVGLSKPWGWNTLCRLDKNKKKKLFVVITVLIKRAAVESQELHITDDPSGACNISALCREKTAAVWKKSQWPSQPPHHCCRLHCLWLQWLAKGDKMHQCISENICCMSWSQKKKSSRHYQWPSDGRHSIQVQSILHIIYQWYQLVFEKYTYLLSCSADPLSSDAALQRLLTNLMLIWFVLTRLISNHS